MIGRLGRLGSEAIGRTVAPLVDGAVKVALLSRSRASRARSSAESLGPRERAQALRAIATLYGSTEHFTRPESFFGERASVSPSITNVRASKDVDVLDLAWPSERPTFAADLSARYLAPRANHVARARLFRGRGSARPAIVLMHGYMGGAMAFEERAWPIEALVRRGLDAVLFVLPFHGLRGNGRRPMFPGSDPRITIEGFRQAIFDLDNLIGHLRRKGAPHVGAMGMSLGGYTTALAATTIADLDFAAPFVPLASLADFARDDDRFVGTDEDRDEQHRLLENAYAVVSPLARPARTPRERIVVLGSERDRITPIAHAERLAAHFGARLVRMPGGHLLQVGRGEAFRELLRTLARTGVLTPR